MFVRNSFFKSISSVTKLSSLAKTESLGFFKHKTFLNRNKYETYIHADHTGMHIKSRQIIEEKEPLDNRPPLHPDSLGAHFGRALDEGEKMRQAYSMY